MRSRERILFGSFLYSLLTAHYSLTRSAIIEQNETPIHSTDVTRRITLKERKRTIKERWPQIRGLADASVEELTWALEHGEQELKILAELQEAWAKRAKARREAWLKGNSQSAQAAHMKQGQLSDHKITKAEWQPQSNTLLSNTLLSCCPNRLSGILLAHPEKGYPRR